MAGGIKIRDVRYQCSQPWPFPGSLMLGLLAEAEENAMIRTDLDNELEDARWFTRAEVTNAIASAAKGFTKEELERIQSGKTSEGPTPADIRLPPPVASSSFLSFKRRVELKGLSGQTAIAHQLIRLWAESKTISPGLAHM